MKLISWNVNGLRACVQKNFMEAFQELDADMFCLQETKLQEGQIDLQLDGYHQYWNYAEKRVIPGRLFLRSMNRLMSATESGSRSMIMREESLL